ncbi:hypothetical protein M0802_005559 [Mischocyttarus mexicanus]|nr:hypothetical protein M0802_005559 [Mischocyttarus mexicanus]
MDTLEKSHACRLCGYNSDDNLNIFDVEKNHIKKIHALLPIMIHEYDFLSKVICNACSFKLDEYYKFYLITLKTDKHSKNQLSWMNKNEEKKVKSDNKPMVRIHNVNVKIEPVDYEMYYLDPVIKNFDYMNSLKFESFPVNEKSRTHGIPDRIAHQTLNDHSCNEQNHKKRFTSNEYNKYPACEDVKNLNDNLSENLRVNFNSNDNDNNFFQKNNKITNQDHNRKDIILKKRSFKELSGNSLNYTLRPRVVVDYVETRRKIHNPFKINNDTRSNNNVNNTVPLAESKISIISTTVKIEKEETKEEEITTEHFKRRALRPRKIPINYNENKRKIYDFVSFPLSQDNYFVTAKKPKLDMITDKWTTKLSNNKRTEKTKSTIKNIKKEMNDDLENCYVIK